MAFFDTLDKYELKQRGLDDDNLDTLDKVLSNIPRAIRAVIKDQVVRELKKVIQDEGVDAVKEGIKALKEMLAADPDFFKKFKDMFLPGMPLASHSPSAVVVHILSFKKKAPQNTAPPSQAPQNPNADVCKVCREYDGDADGACSKCPLSLDDDDTMDNSNLRTPADSSHS